MPAQVNTAGSDASSDDGLNPEQLNALRMAVQMADMYVRSVAVRRALVLRAYVSCLKGLRPMLILLLFVSGIVGVACIIGALQSSFAHCCVPAACENVDGLNGTLPAFTLPQRVCLLTEAQAAAMQCPRPRETAGLLNNRTCTRLTSNCPSPYFGTALIIGIGALAVFLASACLIAPTLFTTVPVILLSWIFVGALGLLAVVLVAVGGGIINSVNGGLSDDGVQTNSNNQGITFADAECFNQSAVRGLTDVQLSHEIAQGQYLAFGCVGFGLLIVVSIPLLWLYRYRRLRADLHRQAVLHILGDED